MYPIEQQRPALFRLLDRVFCARFGHSWRLSAIGAYCRCCFLRKAPANKLMAVTPGHD